MGVGSPYRKAASVEEEANDVPSQDDDGDVQPVVRVVRPDEMDAWTLAEKPSRLQVMIAAFGLAMLVASGGFLFSRGNDAVEARARGE